MKNGGEKQKKKNSRDFINVNICVFVLKENCGNERNHDHVKDTKPFL